MSSSISSMSSQDIQRTVFITYKAIYAYIVMSFRLLNVEPTYQQTTSKVFERNMEVYVDDIIIKQDHLSNLEEYIFN